MAGPWSIVASGDQVEIEADPLGEGAGATFGERLAASFKSSPESEANYYAAKRGAENVRLTRDGEVEIRDARGTWRRADPGSLDLGDIADVAGSLPELIGGAGGAIVGGAGGLFGAGVGAVPGAIAGGAAGSAGGNVIKQAIGALLPGQDVETPLQRVGEVIGAGVMGGVGEGVGQVVQRGVIKPAMQAVYRGALRHNVPAVTEADAIARAMNRGAPTGAPEFRFTPGEETGGRGMLLVEDAMRNDIMGADIFYDRAQQNLVALRDKASRLIDEVRGGARPMSDMAAGGEMQSMFKQVDDAMESALSARADRDFAVLDQPVANRFRFDVPAFKQTLADLASQDINSVGAPGAVAEGVAKLTRELPDQMTVKDMHLYLKRLGHTGYGKGDKGFMEQLGDTDRAKMARRLFAALSKDVEDIANSGAPGHTLAKQLRVAKDNFAAGLEEMKGWQEGLFAKVVGDYSPESAGRVVDNLSKLNADEMRSVMTVVGYRPDVADAVRARWVERAFEKSQAKGITKAGGTADWFNARTFAESLGTPKQIEAMFGRTHRQVLNDLILMQRAVARMNARSFVGESPSQGRFKISRMIEKVPNPVQWPSLARDILVPRKVAKLLLDPKARAELEIVASAKAPTRRVAAAVAYLTGQEAADLAAQE